jgi:hypothetical protein
MNYEAQKSASGLSIAALVTGILGLSIIPVILGSVDLKRIKRGFASPRGKGFDIAGIVLGAVGIVIWIVVIIIMVIFGIWYF